MMEKFIDDSSIGCRYGPHFGNLYSIATPNTTDDVRTNGLREIDTFLLEKLSQNCFIPFCILLGKNLLPQGGRGLVCKHEVTNVASLFENDGKIFQPVYSL